jgi:O-antigen/teichoic acid export membrane protein
MVNDRVLQRQRGIRLGFYAGIVQFGVVAAVQFVLIRVLLGHLGKEGYGAWSILTLIVYWSALFDFGISKGLLNSLADANGRDDRHKAVVATSTAFAVLGGVALVGIVLVWSGVFVWGSEILRYFKLDQPGASVWALGSVGSAFFLNMPLSVIAQVYWAYQLRHLAVVFMAGSSLATLALSLVGAHFHLGLNGMVLLYVLPMVLGTASSGAYLFLKEMPWLRPRLGMVRFAALREMGGTSLGYFCFGMLAFLINETQPSIIARVGTLAITAEWQIINRIILSLSAPIQMSTFSFVPAIREAVANGDGAWMKRAFRKLIIIRMVGAVAGTALLYAFGPFVLRLLAKGTNIEFSFSAWMIIIVTVLVFTWNSCYTDLFSILDRVWYVVVYAGINAVAILWMTIRWVPSIGIRGALLAYVAMPLLLFSWTVPILANRLVFRGMKYEG